MSDDIRARSGWRGLMPVAGVAVLSAGIVSCGGGLGTPPEPPPLEPPASPDGSVALSVSVDSARNLVLVEAGPFEISPASARVDDGGGHGHHGEVSPLVLFDWPVQGWFRGFRVRVVDARGDSLPQELMHHLIGVNFDRRQLVYPVAERFMGVGTETRDVLLPRQVGVPMAEGTRLGVYASWHNETEEPVEAAYMRLAFPYMPGDTDDPPRDVVPIYMDTNNEIGTTNAFDLPPGRTVKSYEFSVPVDGAILGASGHLHDYGRTLRLEDAESGEVLFTLNGLSDGDGHIQGVERKIFRKLFGLLDASVPLEAGRSYRVVGEYFNPTDRTLERGAMAHISGIFAPDSMEGWTTLDMGSRAYREDVSGLPEPFPRERAPAGFPAGSGTPF